MFLLIKNRILSQIDKQDNNKILSDDFDISEVMFLEML